MWHPDGTIDYVPTETQANELAEQIGGFVVPVVDVEYIDIEEEDEED